MINKGSKIGLHIIRPNKGMSFITEMLYKRFYPSVVKAVDDTGIAVDTKKISPNTITITRFVTDSLSLQGLEKWNQSDRINMAIKIMNYVDSRTQKKPEILNATNFIEPVNEADPRGFYDFYGLFLIELVKEANRRNIHLALPAFAAGTPEWDDIVKFRNTGLFKLMKDTGHILSIHEGVFGTQPINQGYGDIIPGAPKIDGAGSLCFRYRYLYSLLGPDEQVDLVISEFYAGGGYNLPPDQVVERLKWYDTEIRKNGYVLGVLPFTCDPDDHWKNANYNYAYENIITYMQSIKDSPNGVIPTPVPVPQPVPVVNNMLVGLHGRADGRLQQLDFACVQQGKIEAVKLLSTAAPEDVDSLKSINPNIFVMVRLFADLSNRIALPNDFVSWVKDDMRNFYNKGVRYFEIHNEPNIYVEGYNLSWKNGSDFTIWVNSVYDQLKQLFPDVKLGFPGISPGPDIPNVRADSNTFLSQLGTLRTDWMGVHVYWQSAVELSNISIDIYKKFNQPLYITEFSNPSDTIDKITKGNQYVTFYAKNLAVAAFCFVSSASSGFYSETWRDEQGNISPIPGIVGSRGVSNNMVGKTVKINDSVFLNIRNGPNTTYPIVGILGPGSQFTVLEQSGIWLRIYNGGWISSLYVKVI